MNLRKIKDKKGSVSIEYIVIVLMVVGVVFGAILLMGRGIKTSIKESNEHLKSSSASKEIGQVYDNTGNERHDGGSESEGYGNDSVWEDEYGGITPGNITDDGHKYKVIFITDESYKIQGEYGVSLETFNVEINGNTVLELNKGTPIKATCFNAKNKERFKKWNVENANVRVNGNTIIFLVEDDIVISAEIEKTKYQYRTKGKHNNLVTKYQVTKYSSTTCRWNSYPGEIDTGVDCWQDGAGWTTYKAGGKNISVYDNYPTGLSGIYKIEEIITEDSVWDSNWSEWIDYEGECPKTASENLQVEIRELTPEDEEYYN